MGTLSRTPGAVSSSRNPPEAQSWPTKRLPLRRRSTTRKRRRRRSTMRRSKPASLNLRSAETFLVGKLVLPSRPPARRPYKRRPTVHFHLWRISCCNKYDFYSWYGSNDSDGTINSKEHYFCYNTNVKLCNA